MSPLIQPLTQQTSSEEQVVITPSCYLSEFINNVESNLSTPCLAELTTKENYTLLIITIPMGEYIAF